MPKRLLHGLAALTAVAGLTLGAAAAWAAPGLPAHFGLAADVAKQPCRAQRVYGDPLINSDVERAYDLFCGASREPVGRAYLLRRTDELGAWRQTLTTCVQTTPLTWAAPGLQNVAASLCQSGSVSPEDGAPSEERLSAERGGRIAAGNALPPAAPALESAIRVLLGVAAPGADSAVAGGGGLVTSLSDALGGPLSGVSPNDFQSLVAAGHESNTLARYSEAEAFFSQAIAAHRTFWPKDRLGDADLKLELALNLSNQRRFIESRARLEEARAELAGQPMALAKTDLYAADDLLNDESLATRVKDARARLVLARTELAQAKLGVSASIADLRRQHLLEAMIWRTTARLAGADLDEARQDLQKAADALDQAGADDGEWLRALMARDRARLEIASGKPQAAVDLLQRAIVIVERSAPGSRLDGDLAFALGGALAAANDRDGAIRAERKAVDIFSKQSESSGLSADEAVSYVTLLLEQNSGVIPKGDPRGQELFSAFEAVSAASVRQTASAAAARLSSGPDADLIRRWQDAQRASVSATAESNRLAATTDAPPAERAAVKAALDRAKAREDALAQAVYNRQPGFATLAQGPVSLAEVQAALEPRDILVRLLVGGKGGAGLLVTRDQVTPFHFKADASRVSALVTRIKTSARHENDAAAFDLAASSELYEALFADVRKSLMDPAHTRMIVDVQGALAALPFGVLVTEPPAKADLAAYTKAAWFGQRFEIVVSAGLRPLRNPTGAIKTFVGYGNFTPLAADASKLTQIKRVVAARGLPATCVAPLLDTISNLAPLDGTKVELETIKANLGGTVHVGADFHPDLLLGDAAFAKADMVVLATHGVFRQGLDAAGSPCLPEAALLASAPTGDGDIFLDAPAVLSLKLDAKLAVLSACDTGNPVSVSPGQTGLPSGGDALSGFARAFIYAGAQNVVVTHWPIRDEFGPQFMQAFTGALKAGRSPEAALKAAQATAIGTADYADPYYWGAFTLVSMGLHTQ